MTTRIPPHVQIKKGFAGKFQTLHDILSVFSKLSNLKSLQLVYLEQDNMRLPHKVCADINFYGFLSSNFRIQVF